MLPRDRTEPGLRVADADTAEDAEHRLGDVVAVAAFKRNVRLAEIAHAENNLVTLLEHRLRAGADILRQMLPVTVDRHHSLGLRPVFQDIFKRRLHRAALALIHLVRKDGHAVHRRHRFKGLLIFRCAAVIHNHDVREPFREDTLHGADHFLIGVQRRKNDRYVQTVPPCNLCCTATCAILQL